MEVIKVNKKIILKIFVIVFLIILILFLSIFLSLKQEKTLETNSDISVSNKKIGWGIKRNDKHEQPDVGKENRKIFLNCHIMIKENKPITIMVTSASNIELYKDLKIHYTSDIIPLKAKTRPMDKNTIISQFSKTGSTPYAFKTLDIDLDHNVFIPKLSTLNDLRRTILQMVEQYAINVMTRTYSMTDKKVNKSKNENNMMDKLEKEQHDSQKSSIKKTRLSLLLNILHTNFDYTQLQDIENVYIPLKYFSMKDYQEILHILDNQFNVCIYMPTIVKSNYKNLLSSNIETTLNNYHIK